MGVFLAILIMMTTGSVAILFVVKMLKREYSSDEKFHLVLRYLVLSVIIILCDLLWGGKALILRLPFDMLVTIFPIMVVTSSIWDDHIALKMSRTLSAFVWMLALFYILHGVGVFPSVSPMHFITCSGIISMLICSAFLLSIILRMREIRQVMKSGNVWSSVCMSIDVIYLLSIVIYITAILVTARVSVTVLIIISVLVSFLLACEMAALGMRVSTDSIFLFWKRQERLIVESMKISQTDVAQDSSKINDMYKDIYTRIVALFESEKLYLNSELTINDIVKVTFTNKLYISRAISQFTGRNFCQFVNYYRVLHSIQMFRENPDLKVIEMATRSGFNSSVSYSMAFRLYMGESPSDWCRKEKFKVKRRKK